MKYNLIKVSASDDLDINTNLVEIADELVDLKLSEELDRTSKITKTEKSSFNWKKSLHGKWIIVNGNYIKSEVNSNSNENGIFIFV